MLDPRVRPRVHEGLVPVVVANEVRRGAVLAAGLDNDRRVLMHPDHFALEVESVANRCSHRSSILWSSTTECARESGWREDLDGMSVVDTEQLPAEGAPRGLRELPGEPGVQIVMASGVVWPRASSTTC
jgi:hypothetical protein